jgi:hypothetical protein
VLLPDDVLPANLFVDELDAFELLQAARLRRATPATKPKAIRRDDRLPGLIVVTSCFLSF